MFFQSLGSADDHGAGARVQEESGGILFGAQWIVVDQGF